MVIDLKMCRFESVPWGFRLVGGSDYEYPLTVVKVTPESIAEKAGMQVGDIIVRINDIAASALTHNEAHDVISNCGNTFFFGIKRETEDEVAKYTQDGCNNSDQNGQNVEITLPSPEIKQNPEHNTVSLNLKVRSPSLQKQNAVDEEDKLEKEIAEILSEEKEILKEHNVVGIFPKPGVCMASKVLRELNANATKTKEEILKEQRRWTTFLQKPDRPIPKSKAEIEAEKIREQTAYKVVIKKQPRRQDRVGTPPWRETTPEPEPKPLTPEPEKVEEEEEVPITDTEVPDLTPMNIAEENSNEKNDQQNDGDVDEQHQQHTEETAQNEEEQNDEAIKEKSEEIENYEKTDEEIQLERQLAQVQQQLLALSNLPTTIQATLDAVTKQLAELLPAIRKHSPVNISQVPDKIETFHLEDKIKKDLKTIEEEQEELLEEQLQQERNIEEHEYQEQLQQNEEENIREDSIETKDLRSAEEIEYERLKEIERNEAELEKIKWESEQKQAKKEEHQFKKQKENGLIEELQHRISNMDESCGVQKKRSKLFGPLVPLTRPLILPGGRKWRTPKDAFNEEFIAEVLSSQAELISGHAIGPTYESPLLGYDERVNFMKYQKPEKKVDLDKSEVFKVLHNLDKRPKHGIEVRPPIVPAEEDIRNVAASCG